MTLIWRFPRWELVYNVSLLTHGSKLPMRAHTSGACRQPGGNGRPNGRGLPAWVLASGVPYHGPRPGREPTGMRPGRPTPWRRGPDVSAHAGSSLPAGLSKKGPAGASRHPRADKCSGRGRGQPTTRGGAARAGRWIPLRSKATDSPVRVARLAARGSGCGQGPGVPAGSPAPCARPPRGFRHGPRAPARSPRWQARELPRRWKVHPACTRRGSFLASGHSRWGSSSETLSRVYTWGELSGIRALEVGQPVGNSAPCVYAG